MRILLLTLAAALSLLLLAPAPATAASKGETSSLQAEDGRPLESAGWHGRAIRNPHRHTADRVADDETTSTGIRRGTGYHTPGGSDRVRTIQRRLRQLGYQPGPVDGKFGPRTEAALRWFEHKHGLEPRRSVAAATIAHLRDRVTGAPAEPRLERAANAAQPDPPATPTPDTEPATAQADHAVISGVLAAMVLLAIAVFFTAFAQARTRRRSEGSPAPPGHRPPPIRRHEERMP